jgi:hypothetical protein
MFSCRKSKAINPSESVRASLGFCFGFALFAFNFCYQREPLRFDTRILSDESGFADAAFGVAEAMRFTATNFIGKPIRQGITV